MPNQCAKKQSFQFGQSRCLDLTNTKIQDLNQNDFPLITFVNQQMLSSSFEEQAKKVLEKWNYQTIRKIGKGGYGHVVLASKFTNSMSFYAIKCLSLKSSSKDANLKKYIQQEVKAMSNIDHPNVVRFETSFQDSGWYFIVMEYCDMGNLLNYQSKANKKTLSFSEASKILLQLLNGIQTIHGHNIIHRDIKCENIFLKKNKNGSGYRCKIGDFGFAKEIDDITRTSCGTTLFMAPEVLRRLPYSYQADVWSVGVVFYFMIFGEYPFKNINIQKQINDKCTNGFSLADAPAHYKQRKQFVLLEDFFRRVFDLDQARRIKLDQMITHKIFKTGDGEGTEDSSFSEEHLEEELEWYLGKIKFIQELISDITCLKVLDPYLIHSSRFYLFKILMSIFKEDNLGSLRLEQPKHKVCIEMQHRETNIIQSINRQFETLMKYSAETKKINKFNQGLSLQVQDFYAIKQGYRNTLSLVYSQIQKKITNEGLKAQLKFRVLCCHLINRVFNKGLKADIFPNFNNWVKKNQKGELKKEMEFSKLREWMSSESAERIASEIQSINKKFYC